MTKDQALKALTQALKALTVVRRAIKNDGLVKYEFSTKAIGGNSYVSVVTFKVGHKGKLL